MGKHTGDTKLKTAGTERDEKCPAWLLPVFPEKTCFGWVKTELADLAALQPEEKALLSANAAPRRVRQFAAGRQAAHLALSRLGNYRQPVLRGERGEPLWPAGTVGSITHTREFALAIAAESPAYQGLGIDLESIIRSENFDGLAERIATPSERDWIYEHNETAALRLTLLFSAKESLFKAIFPLHQNYFGFRDASLVWREAARIFEPGPVAGKLALHLRGPLQIRVRNNDRLVAAATCIGATS